MPLTGLRSYPLGTNVGGIIQAGAAGWDQGQEDQRKAIADARQKLLLLTEQEDAAERARSPQTVTLGAPAVPPGLAATPQPGEDLESRAFLPRTQGIPAASETVTEFPRYENPMEFANRRRKAQARVDAKQAEA